MFFNCSLPHRNATLEKACCEPPGQPAPSPLSISSDNQTAFCTSFNGTALVRCLAAQNVFPEACQLQDVPAHDTISSSAARVRPARRLGVLSLALIGLCTLAVASAADQSATTCHDFARSEAWAHPGEETWTASQRISEVVACEGASACEVRPVARPTWHLEWDSETRLDIGPRTAQALVDSVRHVSVAESVTLPALYDVMAVPPGKRGFVEARAAALRISGQFTGCDDGRSYSGSVSVPYATKFLIWVNTEKDAESMPLPSSPPEF